jgi:enoyl-CoA hydratase/carnithine racemase
MLEFETLALAEAAPHVLIVRLNRPEVANALNTRMGRDLLAVCRIQITAAASRSR